MPKKADKPDDKKPVAAAAVVEPPPEKPPEEKKPAPTVEELEAKSAEFLESMFPPPGMQKKAEPKKKPEPEPEAKKEPEKKEPEPAKPDPEPEPEKKPEPKDKPLPPPIGEAVKDSQLQPPPAPKKETPAPSQDQFTDEDQETVAALARMEREGKAPAGIVARTQKFWTDEQAYIAKWQRENQGAQFDADASEHAEFYEKNEPAYDERAYKAAVRANLKDDLVTQAKAEVKKDAEAGDYERQLRDHAPRNAAVVHDAIKEMVAEAGFKDLMTKDGKLVLSKEVEAEIEKVSPQAKAILIEEADVLGALVSEIDKFQAFPDKYAVQLGFKKKLKSGLTILPHDMLVDFTDELEAELAAQPPENTMREGRRFVTGAEMQSQVQRINASNATNEAKWKAFKHLEDHYYRLTVEDTRAALIIKHSDAAKRKIGQIGGAKPAKPAPEPAKTDLPAAAEFTTPAKAQTKAPSASPSDNVDTAKKVTPQSTISDEQFAKSMWP